jgi:hypothetical protein
MTPNKLLRLYPLFLSLLLSLSAFQGAFAQGAPVRNLSTLVYLQPGTEAIAGFIINGTGTNLKTVVVRGIGPSLELTPYFITPHIDDPVLGKNSFGSVFNDDWSDLTIPVTLQPLPKEAATKMAFSAGQYTAILSGKTAVEFGFALVEIYDIIPGDLKLANISTRAFVGNGAHIVIAGFILGNGGGEERIVLRGLGPSLTAANVPNVLADPTLELRDASGVLLRANNDWQDDPGKAAELIAAGLAPTHNLESGIVVRLLPGNYTVLLSGLSSTTGNGTVEIYDLGP